MQNSTSHLTRQKPRGPPALCRSFLKTSLCCGYRGEPLAFSRAAGRAEREPGNVGVENHPLAWTTSRNRNHAQLPGRRYPLALVSDAKPVRLPSGPSIGTRFRYTAYEPTRERLRWWMPLLCSRLGIVVSSRNVCCLEWLDHIT